MLSTNGQPITVDNEKFTVSENGTVTTNGRPAGQIDIRMEEDVRNLKRDGNDLYSTADGSELPSAAANPQVSYSLKQGVSELSNVDVTSTYTEMTEAYRSFEANQKSFRLTIKAWIKPQMKSAKCNKMGTFNYDAQINADGFHSLTSASAADGYSQQQPFKQ